MKLSGRAAKGYFARPEPERTGLLIYGPDAMRVALKRQEVLAALLGPGAEEEMRLTRLQGAGLRSDPAALADALQARGFFPGPRAVFVDDATDGLAPTIEGALADWQPGDAQLIVTARQLAPRSALRKMFEGHPNAYAAAVYDDPPDRGEVEAMLAAAGLREIDRTGLAALMDLALQIDPGDFRQTVEKLALYKLGDTAPASAEDVAACAPRSTEADADDLIFAVAEGRRAEIAPLLRRLQAQGVTPVTLCIAATRHFRRLHAAATDPEGPARGLARLRPPVPFPLRGRVQRQAQTWRRASLEEALSLLIDTDIALRSAARAPQMPVMERCLIRLAMLGRRRA